MTYIWRTMITFLLVVLTAMIATAAHADGPIVTHRIPEELALEAVAAAVQSCAAKGYSESVVVIDAGPPERMGRADEDEGETQQNRDRRRHGHEAALPVGTIRNHEFRNDTAAPAMMPRQPAC